MEETEKDPLEKLVEKTKIQPGYAVVLPLTVYLHRFEKEHQDFSKPRIFVCEVDEDGFIMSVSLNKIYENSLGEKVEKIMEDLDRNIHKKLDEIESWSEDTAIVMKINTMFLVDATENEVYNAFKKICPDKKHLIDELPPLFEKIYDEKGIPILYKLNPRAIKTREIGYGKYAIKIKGLPISDEEIKSTNMDELFKKLISFTNKSP